MAERAVSGLHAWVRDLLPTSWAERRGWRPSENSDDADGTAALLADDPLSLQLDHLGPNHATTAGFRSFPAHNKSKDKSTTFGGFLRLGHDFYQLLKRKLGLCGFLIIGITAAMLLTALIRWWSAVPREAFVANLLPCGSEVNYMVNNYTCTSGDFLCPVVDRRRTLPCGDACYLPWENGCENGKLMPAKQGEASGRQPNFTSCSTEYLHLTDDPFENYFLSDCDTASQVVITSPLPKSQANLGSARLLVAWPAGNSGIVTYFKSAGVFGNSLSVKILDLPGLNRTLESMINGVSGVLELDGAAQLGTTIIGSIRSLRDYVEGGGVLNNVVQKALRYEALPGGGVLISRQWLDGITESFLAIRPTDDNSGFITISGSDVQIPPGTYRFQAWQNYPFEERLSQSQVLNSQSQWLIQSKETQVTALSFLSSKDKALAGAWRFLTYFGRDTLISLLLLQPVLSEGEGSIIEAILGAALERINSTDGSVCHEEVIGDYATLQNLKDGKHSSDPQCDYKMVDTDYFLMVALEAYLVKSDVGKARAQDFLATNATFLASNRGLTYNELALFTVKKILAATEAFENSPVVDNLIHLKEGVPVGQWRDSNAGLGGGRIPFDVNTALVPATLKAISSLTKEGLLGKQPVPANATMKRAVFWEDNTLQLFQVRIPEDDAKQLIEAYQGRGYYAGPALAPELNGSIIFHGLAIGGGADSTAVVSVMNTDDCFRLFFLNTTNDDQLSDFLQQTSENILQPFPVGLSTPLGLIVANPAYTENTAIQGNLTNGAYHGTVVWSWQLAMMARGLERQLARCGTESLSFCSDAQLRQRVEQAYSHLWDLIDANQARLDGEVWSWTYDQKAGGYQYAALGTLSGPNGEVAVESDIQQLWSLAFIAVQRNPQLLQA